MEYLLDLVFSNIGILIVALAFVYSFIKGMVRQGTDPSKQPKPRQGMPAFGGQQSSSPQRQRMERPSPQQVKVQTEPPRLSKQPASKTVQLQSGSAVQINKAPQAMQAAPSIKPPNEGVSARRTTAATNRPDPVQGMMWAEVFAPPRAKRPYGRNRI